MVQIVPIVQHNTLIYRFNRATHILIVGDPEWFIWLRDARHFAYVDDSGTFTAYKERAGNQRGKSYWRAYRRQVGRLHRVYLGASRELSAARLHAAAAQLAQSDASRQHAAPALDKQLHASRERGHTTALAQATCRRSRWVIGCSTSGSTP